MGIAFNRARWAAPLVFVAVLIMALAPDTADAHGGYGPEVPQTRAPSDSVALPDLGTASPPATSWSPFCPGGTGHICECAELAALVRADEAPALPCLGANLPVRLVAGSIKPPTPRMAPSPAPLLSPAAPRAPPLYS